jgi:hypothetical protein
MEMSPMRRAASLLVALALVLVWGLGLSWAQEILDRSQAESALKVVPELFVVRPLTAIVALVPTAAFMATLPVTYPWGIDQKAATLLVEKPWEYVGNRPFGAFLLERSVMTGINGQIDQQYSEFLGRTGADRNLLDLR